MAANENTGYNFKGGGIGGCDNSVDTEFKPNSTTECTTEMSHTLRYDSCACKWKNSMKRMHTKYVGIVDHFWQKYNQMNRQNMIRYEWDRPENVLYNEISIQLARAIRSH